MIIFKYKTRSKALQSGARYVEVALTSNPHVTTPTEIVKRNDDVRSQNQIAKEWKG